jgi:membrane-associated protein
MLPIASITDWVLHLDDKLKVLVADYGAWTYAILFLIVFCETGLVVTPFLPGDSLLFAAGTLAAAGSLNVIALMVILMAAAIIGDTVNYQIGATVGRRLVRDGRTSRWLKPEHLDRTHQFFEKYGGKTIVIARFVPIVRTFAPFVAGMGAMTYARFLAYNVIGAVMWVIIAVLAGVWFGSQEFVKNNFELVILAIVAISLIPALIELIRIRRRHAIVPDVDRDAKS